MRLESRSILRPEFTSVALKGFVLSPSLSYNPSISMVEIKTEDLKNTDLLKTNNKSVTNNKSIKR